MKEVAILFLSTFITSVGFITRYFWERHIKYQYDIENKKKEQLMYRLEKFYYPIYFNLERLSNLWKISDNISVDEESILIHSENQEIIKNKIVKAKPIPKLLSEIMKYDKHVTMFKILKDREKKPREYEAEYPEEFKEKIKKRIKFLENEII